MQTSGHDFLDPGITGQPENRPTGIGVPVRCAQASKRRYQIDTVIHRCAFRQGLGLTGVPDQLQSVSQPLDSGTGYKNASFQSVGRFAVEAISHRREQAMFGCQRLVAGVQHQETTGAVGAFRHPGFEACLAEQGRLLIPRHTHDGRTIQSTVTDDLAEVRCRIHHLRQQRRRNTEQVEQLRVPLLIVNVEQQGAAGIGRIGPVLPAACQPPKEKTVDGAKRQFSAFRPLLGARHIVQHPANFRRRKIGVNQ